MAVRAGFPKQMTVTRRRLKGLGIDKADYNHKFRYLGSDTNYTDALIEING